MLKVESIYHASEQSLKTYSYLQTCVPIPDLTGKHSKKCIWLECLISGHLKRNKLFVKKHTRCLIRNFFFQNLWILTGNFTLIWMPWMNFYNVLKQMWLWQWVVNGKVPWLQCPRSCWQHEWLVSQPMRGRCEQESLIRRIQLWQTVKCLKEDDMTLLKLPVTTHNYWIWRYPGSVITH